MKKVCIGLSLAILFLCSALLPVYAGKDSKAIIITHAQGYQLMTGNISINYRDGNKVITGANTQVVYKYPGIYDVDNKVTALESRYATGTFWCSLASKKYIKSVTIRT